MASMSAKSKGLPFRVEQPGGRGVDLFGVALGHSGGLTAAVHLGRPCDPLDVAAIRGGSRGIRAASPTCPPGRPCCCPTGEHGLLTQ